MQFRKYNELNASVIDLSGKLIGDAFMQEMNQTLHKLIDEGIKNVVVDLGKVSMITSAGVGSLISGFTSMKNVNGCFKLADVPDKVKGVLYVTKLDTIFNFYDSVDDALNSLKTPH